MYTVTALSREAWLSGLSKNAHASAFGQIRLPEFERIDLALVVLLGEKPISYVQCIEMDAETLYWQIGGAFEYVQGTRHVVPSYLAAIRWSLSQYKRITTKIENTNIRMLHLAMKMGFLVVGTYCFKGSIYLELILEGKTNADQS